MSAGMRKCGGREKEALVRAGTSPHYVQHRDHVSTTTTVLVGREFPILSQPYGKYLRNKACCALLGLIYQLNVHPPLMEGASGTRHVVHRWT